MHPMSPYPGGLLTMFFIDLNLVQIPLRQRLERPRSFLQKLKESIITKGLMHPIVLAPSTDVLIAGEGRIIAIRELHQDGIPFLFNGHPVAPGYIPFVRLGDLTEDMLAEAELEENIVRAQLTWQEESQAKVLIYNLRKKQRPTVTKQQVAEELVIAKGDEPTDASIEVERARLSRALLVSEHMHNPRVREAKTLNEAVKIALDDLENSFKVQLLETEAAASPHALVKGDLLDVLPTLASASFDTIIADPPYGIDADKYKTVQKSAGEKKHNVGHRYTDDPDYATHICESIFREGFRLLRSQGHIFMFCDPDKFAPLRDMAQRMAYTVWRTPLIWHKTGAQAAFAPWGAGGFLRSYEMILFATKGQKTLAIPGGSDVLSFSRIHRTVRQHAAEKPVELYTKLLQLSCIPGDSVLDPCCGSGPIFPAADATKTMATGIELNSAYHAQAAARLIGALEASGLPEEGAEELRP